MSSQGGQTSGSKRLDAKPSSTDNTDVYAVIDKKARNTLKLPTTATAPSWVPDTEVKECMYCSSAFSLMKRRHHCRGCGFVVCSSCSLSRAVLPHSNNVSVRVCDKCVRDLNTEASPIRTKKSKKESKVKTTTSTASQSLGLGAAPQALGMIDVPSWTYAVKPFTKLGSQINVGRVLVRVLSAENIPRLDLAMAITTQKKKSQDILSGIRMFVGLRVDAANSRTPSTPMVSTRSATTEDETAASTDETSRTINGTWQHESLFEVSDRSSVVTLQLQATGHGLPSSGIPLGFATLPLRELLHQDRVKVKLPVELSALLATVDVSSNSSTSGASATPNSSTENTEATITVEAQYIYNSLGQFWSQFSADTDKDLYQRPFNFTRFVRDFIFLLWELQPLLWLCDAAAPLLAWRAPLITAGIFALFLYLAIAPWTVLPLCMILLLRYIIVQYTKNKAVGTKVDSGKKETTPETADKNESQNISFLQQSEITMSEINSLASLCPVPRSVNMSASIPTSTAANSKKSKRAIQREVELAARASEEAAADRELVTVLMTLVDLIYHMIYSPNPNENFSPSNSILGKVDAGLNNFLLSMTSLRSMLSWETPGITLPIAIVAAIILVLSFFMSQTSLYIFVGVAIFSVHTAPVLFIRRAAQSVLLSMSSTSEKSN